MPRRAARFYPRRTLGRHRHHRPDCRRDAVDGQLNGRFGAAGQHQQKLDAIETALMAYRLGNNRLPCPADPALTDIPANAATYGYEAGHPGNLRRRQRVSYTITPSTSHAALGMSIAEGAVPVKALGLPDEFQFDGWGRKFAYAVGHRR